MIAFDAKAFLSSRIAYYPGSGVDGQPVELFGGSHSVHCFVYADYGLSRSRIEAELRDERAGFRGYSRLTFQEVIPEALTGGDWVAHVQPQEMAAVSPKRSEGLERWGVLVIIDRDAEYGDEHGPPRLAMLFLGADGIATYDALFCQESSKELFALVLQDRGFGGNYDSFGGGGLMEKIAQRTCRFPLLLLAADNTKPWRDYHVVPTDPAFVPGGMGGHERRLYIRDAG